MSAARRPNNRGGVRKAQARLVTTFGGACLEWSRSMSSQNRPLAGLA